MHFFQRRSDRAGRPLSAPTTDQMSKGRREPSTTIPEEMDLFGLSIDHVDDELRRYALASRPENYFSDAPRLWLHEIL